MTGARFVLRRSLPVLLALLLVGCSGERSSEQGDSPSAPAGAAALERVVASDGVQLTGVTVAESGRMFVNFPRWREIPHSVVEVTADSTFTPYPNEAWNRWTEGTDSGERAFVCVQSVVADDGFLWVLDPASPRLGGVVDSGAKLVKIDLDTDQVSRVYRFASDVAPPQSYLNDVRIDEEHQYAYITDSGLGALVALNLETGAQRRILAGHPSTQAADTVLTVDGEPLRFTDGSAPQIHSDGIALDEDADSLYYHALTGYHLYRLPTRVLRDGTADPDERAAAVTDLGPTPAPDGMILGPNDNLYMADLERNAVVYRRPDGQINTLVRDSTIRWADTFTLGPDNQLYFTDSRIQDTDWFTKGASVSDLTFPVYRVPLP